MFATDEGRTDIRSESKGRKQEFWKLTVITEVRWFDIQQYVHHGQERS